MPPAGRRPPDAAPWRRAAVALVACVVLAGCSAAAPAASQPRATQASSAGGDDGGGLLQRLEEIEAAVARWRSADDLVAARAGAEAARNLVLGPAGPAYGDADGDGVIGGAATTGLLPGLDGSTGLAQPSAGPCVERDVLGGDWSDPVARWDTLARAIAAWSPTNNTFPSLPSHPQRLVGWATLALSGDDLETALEFAGHAQLHADISLRAVTACGG